MKTISDPKTFVFLESQGTEIPKDLLRHVIEKKETAILISLLSRWPKLHHYQFIDIITKFNDSDLSHFNSS